MKSKSIQGNQACDGLFMLPKNKNRKIPFRHKWWGYFKEEHGNPDQPLFFFLFQKSSFVAQEKEALHLIIAPLLLLNSLSMLQVQINADWMRLTAFTLKTHTRCEPAGFFRPTFGIRIKAGGRFSGWTQTSGMKRLISWDNFIFFGR